jgi:hypothetical protein
MLVVAYLDVLGGHLPIGTAVIVLLNIAISRRVLIWIDVYLDLKRSAYEHYRMLLYEAHDRAIPNDDQEVASGISLTSHLREQPEPPIYPAETRTSPPDLDIIEVAAGWRMLDVRAASEGGTVD